MRYAQPQRFIELSCPFTLSSQLQEISDGLIENLFASYRLPLCMCSNPYILQMVTRILVEEGIESSEVPLAAAAAARIKKEDVKAKDTTDDDDDGEEEKLSPTTATIVITPPKDNNDRKRKADTLDILVKGEPVTAEIVQDTDDISDNDPLIHFKQISSLPNSISDVIRLMDKLQPNRQYYKRQQDSRGECSKIRGKLRKYANANKDKLGVSHWIETNKWKPPDEEALSALMVIIRDMIDKSWSL